MPIYKIQVTPIKLPKIITNFKIPNTNQMSVSLSLFPYITPAKIGIPLQLPGGQKPVIHTLKGHKKFALKTRQ
jgi:hypothetical protein